MSAATPSLLKKIQWRIECFVFLAAERLVALAPLAALWRTGASLSFWAWFVPSRRRIVRSNLRTVLGPETPSAALNEATRHVFRHATANLLCSLKGARMTNGEISRAVEIENREVMDRALETGKGVIAVLCHMGNWELLAHTPPVHFSTRPAGSLYRPLNNPFLDRVVTRRRQVKGTALFAKRSSLHGAIALLREGGILGILSDQRAGAHGVMCPLFGRLFSVTPLAALLHRRTGAAVLGFSMRTTAPGKWVVRIHHPPVGKNNRITPAHVAALLEDIMRRSVPDVFWLTDLWRFSRRSPLALDSKQGPLVITKRRNEPLQPLRVLIRTPDHPEEARPTLPALQTLAASRPDLVLILLGFDTMARFWTTSGIPHEFVPFRGDTPPVDAHFAIVLTADEPAARDLPRVFSGPIYALPEVSPSFHSRQWRRAGIRQAHRHKDRWLALLLSLGMPQPPRIIEYV